MSAILTQLVYTHFVNLWYSLLDIGIQFVKILLIIINYYKGYMGYTNYWNVKKPQQVIPHEALAIIKELVFTLGKDLLQGGGISPTLEPIVSETQIWFNGVDEYEDFHFQIQKQGAAFCKTAQLPYDDFVAATLVVLKHFLGDDLSISNDGHEFRFEHEGIIDLLKSHTII